MVGIIAAPHYLFKILNIFFAFPIWKASFNSNSVSNEWFLFLATSTLRAFYAFILILINFYEVKGTKLVYMNENKWAEFYKY